jgi:hypothetical protein
MKKTALEMILIYLLVISLTMAFDIHPAKAQPYVRVYVDQPLGYIPGVPVGNEVRVHIIIEISGIADNTQEGIIGWGMNVAVDPDVLGIYTPPKCAGATVGYLLYDFAMAQGYSQPTLFPGTADPSAGNWYSLQENIMPTPGGGAGEGYSGKKLVTLVFSSKSQTAYSRIDLMDVEYLDTTGTSYPVDEVIGGDYNQHEVPEFPLGLASIMLVAPLVPIVYLWRTRRKRKSVPTSEDQN